jgi:hypothetical protein
MMKLAAVLSLAVLLAPGCATTTGGTFETPEAAVQRLVESSTDEAAAEELLGPGGFALLRSGDDVADREDLEAVRALIRARLEFEDVGEDLKIALLGPERWELPIPLVRDDGRWRFDVEAGREEVLNRRVGRNELSTLETLRAIVAAQREYAAESRDGAPRSFAARILSTPGRHDGLYWPAAEGEPESPLGPLIAEASQEGYTAERPQPVPYHGYIYRLLTAYGTEHSGGPQSYLDASGHLTRGFAVVAWPATHGNSGVMTFLVDHRGIVFEKDLGPETAELVAGIESYAPDATWSPASD